MVLDGHRGALGLRRRSNVLQIEADMVLGKLYLVTGPGMVIDADGLTLTYSKVKLRSRNDTSDPDLRIDLVGSLLHAKVIQR